MKDISAIIKKVVPPEIQQANAYVPVQADKSAARLDAMENAYGFQDLSPSLFDLWLERLKNIEVNRYPLSWTDELQTRLKEEFAIPSSASSSISPSVSPSISPSVSLMPGNGSDELILLLILLCGGSKARVLSPSPSFSMYSHLTNVLGGKFIEVDLQEDFSLNLDSFRAAIEDNDPALIFIAQPNNPTGNLFAPQALEIALAKSNGLVVVDRAYDFFCSSSNPLSPDITQHPNMVELRTLSKIGMAGLRFGFAAAHPEVIDQLNKLRLPYNINSLTLQSILFAMDNIQYFLQWAAETVAQRDDLYHKMKEISAIETYPSETNFLLFRSNTLDAATISEKLKDNKVLIKNLDKYHPLLRNCLRVSIGSPQDNELFFNQLKRLF